MTTYTRYASRTGEIIGILDIPDTLYDMHSTLLYPGTLNAETHYVIDGEPVERPASEASCDRLEILANGQDVANITGLPVPCMARISGPTGFSEFAVTDGAIAFSVAVPGDYRLQFEAFPVRDLEATIHAV